jgi:hypothetical protein
VNASRLARIGNPNCAFDDRAIARAPVTLPSIRLMHDFHNPLFVRTAGRYTTSLCTKR